MAKTKYKTTEYVNNDLQQLKCKSKKTKSLSKISKFQNEMNYARRSGYFQFKEDPLS